MLCQAAASRAYGWGSLGRRDGSTANQPHGLDPLHRLALWRPTNTLAVVLHGMAGILPVVALRRLQVLLGDVDEMVAWPQMQGALRDAGVRADRDALHAWSEPILQRLTLKARGGSCWCDRGVARCGASQGKAALPACRHVRACVGREAARG